jgi:predicted nucleic acid-binding protein
MSGIDYVLDTNVIVGYLGGRDWAAAFIQEKQAAGATFAVSQITRMELLCFSGITPGEEEAVNRFLGHVAVAGLTDAIEDRAIRLRRAHGIKLPDAIIAATAIELGATLVTCDAQVAALRASDLTIETPQRWAT